MTGPGTGIPISATPHRLRASSNLAFAVVQEESSPSNTDHSVSQSKTMVDLRDKPSGTDSATQQTNTTTTAASDFDLTNAVAMLAVITADLLKEELTSIDDELNTKVSDIASQLYRLQTEDGARFTQDLDALSFDLFKSMSPLTGVAERSTGLPTKLAATARQVLDLLGEHASSREVYMAVDMRCGEMLNGDTRGIELSEGKEVWSSAAETIYLMRLLNSVLPRIRTKKPQGFSQVFGRLPQCLMLGLSAVSGFAQSACESLAEEAIKTCCSTALIVVDWEAHSTGTSEREPIRKPSREALGRFLEGVTVCLPYLAGAKVALSEEYFFSRTHGTP